jgi:hypothetical protein
MQPGFNEDILRCRRVRGKSAQINFPPQHLHFIRLIPVRAGHPQVSPS